MGDTKTVELDVRPILREKKEPFQHIMEAVNGLNPGDTFVLHATFEPVPLLGVMKKKGYGSSVEKIEDDHYIITFTQEG